MFGLAVNVAFALAITALAAWFLRGRVAKGDRPVAAAFLLAVALTGFFGFRLVDRALFWMQPSHQQMSPAPWMTLGFIERSWHLPPMTLKGRVPGTEGHAPKGRTLERIAKDRGIPVEQVVAEINAVLSTLGSGQAEMPPATGTKQP